MKKVLLMLTLLSMFIMFGCSKGGSSPKVFDIVLSADKTEIIADGQDKVNFSVILFDENGKKIDGKADLYVNESKVSKSEFTSQNTGNFTVYAKSGDVISNQLTIKVNRIPEKASKVLLVSDKETILANGMDKVKFTANVYNQYDEKMEELEAKIYVNGTRVLLDEYTTKEVGNYEVYAKYEEIISNTLIIEAEFDPIRVVKVTLTPDKAKITADGMEEVKFTVDIFDQYNEKMENQAYQIYVNKEVISGTSFKTAIAGEYEVYAEADNITSSSITITAEHLTFSGDFTITNDMTQDYLDSIGRVTGTIYCNNEVTQFEMKNLKSADKGIYFNETYFLEKVSFPNLEYIGKMSQSVYIEDNYRYFGLRVSKCYALKEIDMPSLKTILGEVYINENGALDTINFNSLETIEHKLSIFANNMQSINFESLKNLKNYIRIFNENKLESIEFPSLQRIEIYTSIRNNSNLKIVKMNALEATGDCIEIYDNSKLEKIEMRKLITINNYMYLKGMNELKEINFESLEKINNSNSLYYRDNEIFPTKYYLSLEISDCNNIENISFSSLSYLDKGMHIYNNSKLNSLKMPNNKSFGDSVMINNNALKEIDFSNCTNIKQRLWVYNENSLVDLDFPSLTEISIFTTIYNNNLLESIKLNKLVSTKEYIYIYSNPKLKSIEMNNLRSVENYIKIVNLPELIKIDLTNLRTINNSDDLYTKSSRNHYISLEISNCSKIEEIKFDSMTSLNGGIYIMGNASLKSLSFPILNSFGDTVWIFGNVLQNLEMPELIDLKQWFCLTDEFRLKELNLPNLVSCIGNFQVYENNSLAKVNAPKLNSIGGELYMLFKTVGEIDLDDNVVIKGKVTLTNGVQK